MPSGKLRRIIVRRSARQGGKQMALHPKILIVKLSAMGDLLHALPAVRCLKRGLNAEISWVVHPAYAELAACFADVSRVLVFPRRGSPAEMTRCIRVLREEQYDLVLDFQGILKSAFVTALARGKRRVGPSFHREGSRLFYGAVAGVRNKNRHAVDELLDFARYFRVPLLEPVFPLNIPMQLVSESSPRVALLPASRWPSKNWSPQSFAWVGRELQEGMNASVFLFGAEGERRLADQVEAELKGRVTNLAGRTSLPQLAGLLREMDLVISNDTGPMHLAAAMGANVLALYGPSDPVRTGPFGPHCRVVKGKLLCQPCFMTRCRYGDNSCMRTITPDQVVTLAMEMLSSRPGKMPKR